MNLWTLVIATIVGCYLLKLAGYLVPARVLEHQRTRRLVELVPVALLAALVVGIATEVVAAVGGSYYSQAAGLAILAVVLVARPTARTWGGTVRDEVTV